MAHMNKCTRRTLWGVAALLVLLAVAVFLRSKAPPEAARLLPESDGIIYFNFKPIRSFFRKELKPPQRAPEYQQFINAIGIDPERDVDEVAIALHRMADPNGPNGPVAYSMVLVGKITGQRLNTWLDAHATAREFYAGHTIYSIPSENRTVRVAQVGYDMLAVSNTPTPEQIHSMLDRHATAAWPFAGSTLLRQHYSDVPLLSLAWGVGQIGLPFSESGAISILGFPLQLADNSTLIASAAPELPIGNSLRVRVEEIAPNDTVANSQAFALTTLVTLARSLTVPLADNPTNNGLKEILRTTKIDVQKRNRVVMTATLSRATFNTPATGGSTPAATPVTPGKPK
jgi:hypothetical protein